MVRKGVLILMALVVIFAGSFLLPRPTCSDATGCSLDGANPGSCGGDPCCWGTAGQSTCYVCYYTTHGGTTKCSEGGAGNNFCIDYQW
jgi:hypothetical protein